MMKVNSTSNANANSNATKSSNITANTTTLVESKNKISSKSDGGMSDADVKCYTDRYGDVKGDAREHYANVGEKEGR
jgi:hypothetical protein